MQDHLEDSIERMLSFLGTSAYPLAKCRLTALGEEERVRDTIEHVRTWEKFRRNLGITRCPIDESGAGRTYDFWVASPGFFVKDMQLVAPDVLILISWGFPIGNSPEFEFNDVGNHIEKRHPEDRTGRAILFRWDRFVSATGLCGLSYGKDETAENVRQRIHLWGMELYRTHHQWKQGMIDATKF